MAAMLKQSADRTMTNSETLSGSNRAVVTGQLWMEEAVAVMQSAQLPFVEVGGGTEG